MTDYREHISDGFYTEKYNDSLWLRQREKDAKYLLSRIKKISPFKEGDKILDVGCGSGELGLEIKNQFQAEVYGMDLNEIAIRRAREKKLMTELADIDQKWPYRNGFFDSVVGSEIIEHVLNPDNFMKESYRVLKPGSSLILTTPNLAAWFNRIIFLFGFQPFFTEVSTIDKTIGLSFTRKMTPHRRPMGHIRCFTLKALKEILEMYGFEIILVRGATVYYLPKFMSFFDYVFSFMPSLSTDITVVAKKKPCRD